MIYAKLGATCIILFLVGLLIFKISENGGGDGVEGVAVFLVVISFIGAVCTLIGFIWSLG